MPKRIREHHEFLLEQLREPIFASEYLNEARRYSKAAFLKALRNVAEARRMAVVAAETGLNRESLYKSLSEDGHPSFDTYDSVLSVLGIDYEFKPKEVESSGGNPTSQAPEAQANIAAAETAITSEKVQDTEDICTTKNYIGGLITAYPHIRLNSAGQASQNTETGPPLW